MSPRPEAPDRSVDAPAPGAPSKATTVTPPSNRRHHCG